MKSYRLIALMVLLFGAAACLHTGFVRKNLETFHEFTLKNGIPVVVKITPHSRIQAVVCGLQGGKALVPAEKAGLDTVVLQLMEMESQHYTDVQRRSILKRTSATINGSDGLDFSLFCLKTIDTYFDETFNLYADLFMHPVFPQKFLDEVVTNMKNKYSSDLTDGFARVSLALNREFFSGHPYRSYLYDPSTLDTISREDVQRFYAEHFVARRMVIFAAGNFSIDMLRSKLDTTLGSITPGSPYTGQTPGFKIPSAAPLVLDSSDALNEVSYVRTNFPVIPLTHKDYWALLLAEDILSDILTDLLRTKNSLVYSAWTLVYGKQANYATIAAYRTNNPLKSMELIGQALDIAASGRCVSPYQGQATAGSYVPIHETLDFYKASFATSFYSGIQTNADVARKMTSSYLLTGDYTEYLKAMDKIMAVSAEDVRGAAAAYLKNSPKQWAVSARPETIRQIQQACSADDTPSTVILLQ